MKLAHYLLLLLILVTSPVVAEDALIKIGWSGPLTGNSAVLGIDSVKAAQIAIDEINESGGISGRKVELVVEDDQYNTNKALTSYSKLVNVDNVSGILMSTYGGVFATPSKAVKDEIIVIDPLDCNNAIAELESNTFCLATESESIGRIIGESILSHKFKSVGVVYDETNPFMVLVKDSLEDKLGTSDVAFNEEGVSSDTADFKDYILKFRKNRIDALVLFGHDPMGTAMKQARGLGLDSQFYTVGTITSPGYQKLAGDAADGTLVAYWEAPKSEAYKQFITKFTKIVGRPPILELATIPTYDSTKLLLAGVESSLQPDGSIDVISIRNFLLSVKDYEGLSGNLTMDGDGAVRSIREAMYRFNDGKLENE